MRLGLEWRGASGCWRPRPPESSPKNTKSPYPSVYSFPHPSGPQAFSMEFNRCNYRKRFSWFQRLWQQVSSSANLGETNAGFPDEMKTRFRMPPDPPLWPSVPSAQFLHLYFSFCFYFPLIKSLINSRFILEHGVTFENFLKNDYPLVPNNPSFLT